MLPFIGYLLHTAAFLGISLARFAGQSVGVPLLVLLGLSGLGLGTELPLSPVTSPTSYPTATPPTSAQLLFGAH